MSILPYAEYQVIQNSSTYTLIAYCILHSKVIGMLNVAEYERNMKHIGYNKLFVV